MKRRLEAWWWKRFHHRGEAYCQEQRKPKGVAFPLPGNWNEGSFQGTYWCPDRQWIWGVHIHQNQKSAALLSVCPNWAIKQRWHYPQPDPDRSRWNKFGCDVASCPKNSKRRCLWMLMTQLLQLMLTPLNSRGHPAFWSVISFTQKCFTLFYRIFMLRELRGTSYTANHTC